MTKEHEPQAHTGFDLHENERLFDRLSDKRFEQLVFDEETVIHQIKLDSNSYGEFLFLTASRPNEKSREVLTFWGYGLHEHRDRWLMDEWFFHSSSPSAETLKQNISHDKARELLQERKQEISKDTANSEQSQMGALFEMLADLADDDGILAEMQDLGWMLFDDLDEE
jgi:hypothetical protein